jgi:hypothetical protein
MVYVITYYHDGRMRTRKFATMKAASDCASAIFTATGIVVGITTA